MTDPAAGPVAGDRGPLSGSRASIRLKRRRLWASRAARERAARIFADEDLVWLMNRREGRRFVWRLLQGCHLYDEHSAGSGGAGFRAGERNVGLRLLADIVRLCPDLHARMAREAARDAGSLTSTEI